MDTKDVMINLRETGRFKNPQEVEEFFLEHLEERDKRIEELEEEVNDIIYENEMNN